MKTGEFYLQPTDKTPLDLDAWPSLDEIKTLAEAYWRALVAAEEAWKALPPSMQRRTQAPGKSPLS